MQLKPGTRLFSQACETQVMVVRAPATDVEVRCGGGPMLTAAPAELVGANAGHDGGSLMGKRYIDQDDTLELLCTKPGAGALAIDEQLLILKETKALPSSD